MVGVVSSPSLQTIADKLGISKMTVSRALRGERYVDTTLREQILQTAADLGYSPDPDISKLMTHMRRKRLTEAPRTLAFIWSDRASPEAELSAWSQQLITGARQRARHLGFQLDEFYLAARGMSGRRLSEILHARGISGFILSPLVSRSRGHVSMQWEQFSSVVIGLGYARPPMHRVHHHHYLGMMTAMRQLKKLGYRRIGYYGGSVVDDRMFGAWSASFLAHHPLPLKQAAELLNLKREPNKEDFRRWLEHRTPEVVIESGQTLEGWLEDLPIPEKIGLVTLGWRPDRSHWAGIDQQVDVLGATAIDLLVAQEQQNERGIPHHPKIVMTEGLWRAGKTVHRMRI